MSTERLKNAGRVTFACIAVAALVSFTGRGESPRQRTFSSPEDAVRALIQVAGAGTLEDVGAFFGPDGKELLDSSDPATANRNRQVFAVAAAEQWHLTDAGNGRRVLVVGNEAWPFPVPLVRAASGWRFDTAAGKEEVLARRIGRNELAAIEICRTYVAAQRLYAQRGHDGRPAGLYAKQFQSDPGRQNGLYWVAERGQKRSPLGDLVAHAAEEGAKLDEAGPRPSPFHGYYFKILLAQGSAAPGGAKTYLVDGELSRGFALVAWPAQHDATGVMTFIVNQDGIVREKDLGAATDTAARAMTDYDPDASWTVVP